MKKAVLLIIAVTLLFSCSSFVYYPNGINAPLLTNKHETQLSIGIKGFGGDIRFAHALADHWGMQVNANLLNVEHNETIFGVSTNYRNGNYYGEIAGGYFTEIIPKLVLEAYLGAGTGQTFSKNLDNESIRRSNYSRLYLQQDIGLRTKIIDFGLGLKEAYVDVYKTYVDGVDQNVSGSDFFFETFLFLGIGYDKFKINAQAGISQSTNLSALNYAPFILSVGVDYRFNLNK